MAEEEILEEAAPPPKKKQGGGLSGIWVLVFAFIVIVAVGITYVLISGKFAQGQKELESKIDLYRSQANAVRVFDGEIIPMLPCKGDNVVVLTKSDADGSTSPMIVNLADGDSYLSLEIALCLEEELLVEDFTVKYKSIVKHVCNEYLSQFTKAHFFPGMGDGEAVVEEPAADEVEAMSGWEDEGEESGTDASFLVRKDQVRAGLLLALGERGQSYVKDVYFTSFLIQ